MASDTQKAGFEIPETVLKKWQDIIDTIAELFHVPAALIMRIVESDIEVFVSSNSAGNPYKPGDHEHFLGSGLYCETVVNKNRKLLVPNALKDEKWKNNPDIKLNMISYLGFPILQPDGKAFGTICVLDDKENAYTETYEKLLAQFRDIIQNNLELVYMNHVLGSENKRLSDYMSEIQTLRRIVPLCGHCKSVRDDEGYWQTVESYIARLSEAQISHGICPACVKKYYPELDDVI